jgi:hypothetical protein
MNFFSVLNSKLTNISLGGSMPKLISKRKLVTKKDIIDLEGTTIRKGTTLFVVNDSAPKHPKEGYKLLVVRVDNGTGHLDLCPETCIKDTDLK